MLKNVKIRFKKLQLFGKSMHHIKEKHVVGNYVIIKCTLYNNLDNNDMRIPLNQISFGTNNQQHPRLLIYP